MKTKIKYIYNEYYKPIIRILDKYFTLSLYYILHTGSIFLLLLRSRVEEYIIKNNYSNLSQYERVLTSEARLFWSMQIQTKMTWVEVHNMIFAKSDETLSLTRRQCVKLIELSKKNGYSK